VYANHLHRVISSTIPEQYSIIEHFDLCLDNVFDSLDYMEVIKDYINEISVTFQNT